MCEADFSIVRHAGPINSVDIKPDLKAILTASSDNSIGVTSFKTRKTKFLNRHTHPVYCAAYSPDCFHFVSSSSSGVTMLWDSNTLEMKAEFAPSNVLVRRICWSPDGRFFATASNDSTACIWSVNRFARKHVLSGLKGWARDVKWIDGMIAVAGNDPNILIYDPRTATVVLSLHSSPHSEISSISFHYTGKALVAGSFDQSMRIYDLRNATLLQQLIPHSSPVTQVAFHPFTDFLLSADKEGICRITNVQTDEVVAWMQDHEKQVWGVTWGSSGQCFATTGEDRQILTYKVRPKPPDAYDYEFDGGNMLVALNHLQNEFNQLTNTMKTLDNRLLIQEEKLQWLCDIDDPISKRMS